MASAAAAANEPRRASRVAPSVLIATRIALHPATRILAPGVLAHQGAPCENPDGMAASVTAFVRVRGAAWGLSTVLALGCSGTAATPDATARPDVGIAADVFAVSDGSRADTAVPSDLATPQEDAVSPDVPAVMDGGAPTDLGAPDAGAVTDAGADTGVGPVDATVTHDAAAGIDGGDAGDTGAATDASGFDAPDGGPFLNGFVRFLNLSPGAGTVRFIAVSQPGFAGSAVEAVVPEGGNSGYIPTLPVPYLIDVLAAPGATPAITVYGGLADGGTTADVLPVVDASTDAPEGGTPRLADRFVSDVYSLSGCTVIFGGIPTGSVSDRTDRELTRISDIPMRSDTPGLGLLVLVSAVPTGVSLDIDNGTTPLARSLPYIEPTGFRRVPAGVQHLTVRSSDDGTVLVPDLAVNVTDGQPNTLYVWGLPDPDGGTGGLHGLMMTDLPPGR